CHATDETGATFADEDVVNHMIFLMMAAHDTSTITTTSTAYYLGKHPDWQDRARAESAALGPGPLDLAALDSLSTLDLVIKESLRMVAPVPTTMRRTVRDTEILGHFVPGQTLVAVAPMLNHYLSEFWSEPMTFDPLRFAEPRREDRSHRLAWVPFGGGAHKCIGMQFGIYEVKALLHAMLLRYTWRLPPDYELRWDHTALPVPVDGLPVSLTPRRGLPPRS
ncbi:MAG: cytochrome P450, partial [Thermocrispum sp.]